MASYILRDLPPDIWDHAKARAQRDGWPLRALILRLLEDYGTGRMTPSGEPPLQAQPVAERCPVCHGPAVTSRHPHDPSVRVITCKRCFHPFEIEETFATYLAHVHANPQSERTAVEGLRPLAAYLQRTERPQRLTIRNWHRLIKEESRLKFGLGDRVVGKADAKSAWVRDRKGTIDGGDGETGEYWVQFDDGKREAVEPELLDFLDDYSS